MFLDVVGTHTKYIINDFALATRTDLLNFKCHTVTNGTDLRKSPPMIAKTNFKLGPIEKSIFLVQL